MTAGEFSFLIVLLQFCASFLHFAVSTTNCPVDCECPSVSSIKCSNVRLPEFSIPQLDDRQTELTLQNCHLPVLNITSELANRIRLVKRLTIVNCQLEQLVIAAKEKLENLQFLSLSQNLLRFFPSYAMSFAFPSLRWLDVSENQLQSVSDDTEYFSSGGGSATFTLQPFSKLESVNLSQNGLYLFPAIPATLISLNLSSNRIYSRSPTPRATNGKYALRSLDLSFNQLTSLGHSILKELVNLRVFYLSHNPLAEIANGAFQGLLSVTYLDLSHNLIDQLKPDWFSAMPKLVTLNVSCNPISTLANAFSRHRSLQVLSVEEAKLNFINTADLRDLSALSTLSVSNNPELIGMFGKLSKDAPRLRKILASNCSLAEFSPLFFADATLEKGDFSANPFVCDCRAAWVRNINNNVTQRATQFEFSGYGCNVTSLQQDDGVVSLQELATVLNSSCNTAGISGIANGQILMAHFGETATLNCGVFGLPEPTVRWSRVDHSQELLEWNPIAFRARILYSAEFATEWNVNSDRVRVLPNGALVFSPMTREDVGIYRCNVSNLFGSASVAQRLRLDYSHWTLIQVYCVISGIITAIVFSIVNIIYVSARQCVVARVKRMERTSRIRMALEAMERYKQRQADTLYQAYTNRVQAIRDNYNLQVEQLRKGYSQQTDRFRSYKEAQWEHVASLRDSYTGQITRVREYGLRQLDRLYDNYQSQLGRIRSFSVQQRLRLMHQYKVQQRYVDKLLRNLNIYESESVINGDPRANKAHQMKTEHAAIFGNGDIALPQLLPEPDGHLRPLPFITEETELVGAQRPGVLHRMEDDNWSLSSYHSLPYDLDLDDDLEADPVMQEIAHWPYLSRQTTETSGAATRDTFVDNTPTSPMSEIVPGVSFKALLATDQTSNESAAALDDPDSCIASTSGTANDSNSHNALASSKELDDLRAVEAGARTSHYSNAADDFSAITLDPPLVQPNGASSSSANTNNGSSNAKQQPSRDAKRPRTVSSSSNHNSRNDRVHIV